MAKQGKWRTEHLSLVTSYGLKWDRVKTKWPHLLGERRAGRKKLTADFRNQMGLYILYQDDDPQYVGIADRLGERIGAHRGDHLSKKWNRFSWFGSKFLLTGADSVDFDEPRGAIGVRQKRMWHDFEAVIFHAFRFRIAPAGYGDGPSTARGANMRVPVFGGDAQEWKQVGKPNPKG